MNKGDRQLKVHFISDDDMSEEEARLAWRAFFDLVFSFPAKRRKKKARCSKGDTSKDSTYRSRSDESQSVV